MISSRVDENTDQTPAQDLTDRVCILGAGSSGLAAAKNLKTIGVAFDCLERQTGIGGNWLYGSPASSVYASTHLISSKLLTEYSDFPMPDAFPEFPHHSLVLGYLEAYAEKFGLYQHIELGAGVERVEPAGRSGWLVKLESGELRRYGRLVIANGHNWSPRCPAFPGEFRGETIHSSQYKTPELLTGKRVLVVGGGNSGCDIAVEASQHAASTAISLRRGYHFLPKFFHGTPIDVCGERLLRWRVPLAIRRLAAKSVGFFLLGRPEWVGLPKSDHRLFESHPVINSQLFYHLGHGDLVVRPQIESLQGDSVRFVDGVSDAYDLIIYATGFNIALPFIDRSHVNWQADRPELLYNILHPDRDDLFFVGLIQPDSGQFGLVDYQSQLVAEYLAGLRIGSRAATRLRGRKRDPSAWRRGVRYVDSPRHLLEVEHFGYRRQLQKAIRPLRRERRGRLAS